MLKGIFGAFTDSNDRAVKRLQPIVKAVNELEAELTPLTDGQVSYVVETYFKASDLSLGSFAAQGVYARYFF